MSEHTPGPWHWHWAMTDGIADGRIFTNPANSVVGIGAPRCIAVSPRYENSRQWEANARLIAAAPDMLKALTAAKIILKNRDQDEREAKVLAYIQAVIAQAEGRAADETADQ